MTLDQIMPATSLAMEQKPNFATLSGNTCQLHAAACAIVEGPPELIHCFIRFQDSEVSEWHMWMIDHSLVLVMYIHQLLASYELNLCSPHFQIRPKLTGLESSLRPQQSIQLNLVCIRRKCRACIHNSLWSARSVSVLQGSDRAGTRYKCVPGVLSGSRSAHD